MRLATGVVASATALLLVLGAGCSSSTTTRAPSSSTTTASSQPSEAIPVGQPYDFETWTFEVISAEQDADALLSSYIEEVPSFAPEPGHHYVFANVEMKNTGDRENYVGSLHWACIDVTGRIHDEPDWSPNPAANIGPMPPGTFTDFDILCEVPNDTPEVQLYVSDLENPDAAVFFSLGAQPSAAA